MMTDTKLSWLTAWHIRDATCSILTFANGDGSFAASSSHHGVGYRFGIEGKVVSMAHSAVSLRAVAV